MQSLLLFIGIFYFIGCAGIKDDVAYVKSNIPQSFSNQHIIKKINKNHQAQSKHLKSDLQSTFFSLFHDKSLHFLAQKALQENRNLLILESNILQARANAKMTTWNLVPRVNAGINYNYSDNNYKKLQTTVTQNTLNANLSLNWEIDIFGKNNAKRLAGKQKVLESMANFNAAQVILLGDVAYYYFLIRQKEQSMLINRNIVQNLEAITSLLEKKYQLGLIDINALAGAKEEYLTQQNTLFTLSQSLEENKNALLVLLNEKNNLDFFILDSEYIFGLLEAPYIEGLPSTVIFNRPDVQSGVFLLHESLYQAQSKKLALFPAINLSGNIGQILFSSKNGIFDFVWQIAGSLTTPIFNNQALMQDYIIAKEATRQALYSLEHVISVALAEIENALHNLDITMQSVLNAQKNLSFSLQSYEISESLYKEGLIDEVSRIEQENIYLRSKLHSIESYFMQNNALITLYKAFGGSFSPYEINEEILLRQLKKKG